MNVLSAPGRSSRGFFYVRKYFFRIKISCRNFSLNISKEGERIMSEQVLQRGNAVERSRTRTIAQVAMLGAVAGVLMNLEFPIPFLAPSFLSA